MALLISSEKQWSYTNNINELVAKVLEVEVLTLISSETKEEEDN